MTLPHTAITIEARLELSEKIMERAASACREASDMIVDLTADNARLKEALREIMSSMENEKGFTDDAILAQIHEYVLRALTKPLELPRG